MTDLRKAAQDVVDAKDFGYTTQNNLNHRIEALRAALASCPDCGKPTPEGSIHTCSPQKPDSDAKQRLLEIMRRNSLATGHGDTLAQVIDTLEVELTDRRDAVCEWTCKACRETGLLHCSDPEHCGGMIYTESEASRNSRRYKWLVDYSLASTNTHDEAIINATTLEEFNAAIDAAMQQEQSNGTL